MRPFMIISRMIPDDGFLKHVFHMLKYVRHKWNIFRSCQGFGGLLCDAMKTAGIFALWKVKNIEKCGVKSHPQRNLPFKKRPKLSKIPNILKPPIDSSSKSFLNDFQPAWMSESESCLGTAPKSGQNNKTSWKRSCFQAGKCKRMQKTSNVNHFSGTFHWTFLMLVMFGSLVIF